MGNLNRPIRSEEEPESAIKNLPKKKGPEPEGFRVNFTKHLKEN